MLPATVTATATHLDTARPAIDGLTRAWLASLTTDKTREAYASDLRAFLGFLDGHDLDAYTVTRPVLDAWRLTMETGATSRTGRPLAPSTIARRLAAVRSFYDYALDMGVVAANPVARVKAPRVSHASPTLGMDREQARAMRAEAASRDADTAGLVALLLDTALRISEALALDVSDIEAERDHLVARIVGKGGKHDTMPLPPTVVAALAPLLDGRTDGPLFRHKGQRMTRYRARYVVGRMAAAAGIPGKISPHSFRHTAATLALDSGLSIRETQALMRHADIRTTEAYDRGRRSLDNHPAYALAAYMAAEA
jgi:site-specific recombinase XerD